MFEGFAIGLPIVCLSWLPCPLLTAFIGLLRKGKIPFRLKFRRARQIRAAYCEIDINDAIGPCFDAATS